MPVTPALSSAGVVITDSEIGAHSGREICLEAIS